MSNQNIFKYIKILLYVLMGLGVVVFVYWLIMSMVQPQMSTEFPGYTVGNANGVGAMLTYTYFIAAIALIVALAFPLINIIKNPKGAMRSLIGMGAMIVVLGVGYLLSIVNTSSSPDARIPNIAEGGYFPLGAERLADVGLYAAYIMLVAAFLLIIGSEVYGTVKKR